MTATTVRVTYTGQERPFVERNYQSGLTFERGQSRAVPEALAAQLLRHADVFELATGPEPKAKKAASDDTAEQLALAAKEQEAQAALQSERQNAVDQIQNMDKAALNEYSRTRYGQTMPNTMSADTMRAKVIGLVDQYGLA